VKRVSFDFDSTLSRVQVQDYARSLVNKGYEVWIITSRYPEDIDPKYKVNGAWVPIDNSDLFEVSDRVGIKREHIVFTSHELKSEKINELGIPFIFHLDDDWVEINHINRETKTKGISCFGTSGWKNKCKKVCLHEG
jgi:hypothetical protein